MEIAASFSDKYAEADLGLRLTESEFGMFMDGIYASSMDERWNIFLIENHMYWARSWTDICIFKITLERQNEEVVLQNIKVTRNPDEYQSYDLDNDIGMFKKLLDFYLTR